jgi:hypothetical protein
LVKSVSSTDDETKRDACWALSYVTKSEEGAQTVIESSVIPKIMELLAMENPAQFPALRVVGNLASGSDEHNQYILDCDVMRILLSLCDHPKDNIRKETCWILSNISAGTPSQAQAVIDMNIIPKVISMLPSAEVPLQSEIAWVISNISNQTLDQKLYLAHHRAIAALCTLLASPRPKTLGTSLQGIENLLDGGQSLSEEYSYMKEQVEECGGVGLIENLENHSSSDISAKARRILGIHFCKLRGLRNVEWESVTVDVEHVCPICLDCFDVDMQHCRLSCGHIFHESCMHVWAKRQLCCPYCRSSIKKSKNKQKDIHEVLPIGLETMFP